MLMVVCRQRTPTSPGIKCMNLAFQARYEISVTDPMWAATAGQRPPARRACANATHGSPISASAHKLWRDLKERRDITWRHVKCLAHERGQVALVIGAGSSYLGIWSHPSEGGR